MNQKFHLFVRLCYLFPPFPWSLEWSLGPDKPTSTRRNGNFKILFGFYCWFHVESRKIELNFFQFLIFNFSVYLEGNKKKKYNLFSQFLLNLGLIFFFNYEFIFIYFLRILWLLLYKHWLVSWLLIGALGFNRFFFLLFFICEICLRSE